MISLNQWDEAGRPVAGLLFALLEHLCAVSTLKAVPVR